MPEGMLSFSRLVVYGREASLVLEALEPLLSGIFDVLALPMRSPNNKVSR